MTFYRNDFNSYNLFMYGVDDTIMFVYTSTPKTGKVAF